MIGLGMKLAEQGRLPNAVVRLGIRRLLHQRLREAQSKTPTQRQEEMQAFVDLLRRSPIAMQPDRANEQHYEVPPDFFRIVLGPHLKYSCCLYEDDSWDLKRAEEAMLALTCERATLRDGQRVLELGCGWGALTLWMAEAYPKSRITAVSNSAPQRQFILDQAEERGLTNVEVLTRDMNELDLQQRFDRVVSLEMFEHMHNYDTLLQRIGTWLEPDGLLFVHIFTHRDLAYEYQDRGPNDWMARHFFSGGIMPSDHLLYHFQHDLVIDRMWVVDGKHYERTCNHWLQAMDRQATEARAALVTCYGEDNVDLWVQRWRMFFMACAELFGMRQGSEWHVCHYRFRQRQDRE